MWHNDPVLCLGGAGGRYYHGTYEIRSNALSVSHMALFIWSQKVEMWDTRVCQMWNRMHDFVLLLEDVIKHYTLAAAMSQQHIVKCAFFYSFVISRLWKSTAYLLHIYRISFAFGADFLPLVFSIITIPPYLIFFPLQPTISFHVWLGWSKVECTLFLPPSPSLYLPFLLSTLYLPPSIPKEQL